MRTATTAPTRPRINQFTLESIALTLTITAQDASGTITQPFVLSFTGGGEAPGIRYSATSGEPQQFTAQKAGITAGIISTYQSTAGTAAVKLDAVLAYLQAQGLIPS
ncbi:MAG TPA: hypothetical protein VD931_10420 [Baekduia sp.]|nr:hypothetical protein [Baekduia sp.]